MTKFTRERFLCELDAVERGVLLDALASGYQLRADAVSPRLAPCVVMLAAYARRCLELELVDDYDELITRQRAAFASFCHHPELYLASCICLLHAVGDQPSPQAFTDVGLDNMFEELVATEEE